MTNDESTELGGLEGELRMALSWEPPAAAAELMDRRVRQAAAAKPETVPRARGGWQLPRHRVIVLLFAGLLLVGAASALTLLQQAVNLDPRWRAAYERAERLDLSQTIDDYTVTIERAYADPNQLVLAIALEGPGDTFVALPQVEVTDADGRHYLAAVTAGFGDSASGGSGSIHAYQVPPGVSGPLDLTVMVQPLKSDPVYDLTSPPLWFSSPPNEQPMDEPGLVGPWVFRINLQLHPATTVSPKETVEAAGVPVTLTSVRFTETSVRVRLDTDLSAVRTDRRSKWSLEASIRHANGTEQALDWMPLPPDWTGQPIGPELLALVERAEDGAVMVRQTFAGSDSPSGSWTLTIRRLIGSSTCVVDSPWRPCSDAADSTDIEGPWIFHFDVP